MNSWTVSVVRVELGTGERHGAKDREIHWKSVLDTTLSQLLPPTHVLSLLPRWRPCGPVPTPK